MSGVLEFLVLLAVCEWLENFGNNKRFWGMKGKGNQWMKKKLLVLQDSIL